MFRFSSWCHPTRTIATKATASPHKVSRNGGFKGHATYVGERKVCSTDSVIPNCFLTILYLVRCQFPFHQLYASATFIVIGDGVHMPGNRCSNCVSYSLECTYVEASKVMVFFDVAVTQWLITLRRNEGHQKGECIVYNTITSSKIGGFPIKLRWKPRESGRKVG